MKDKKILGFDSFINESETYENIHLWCKNHIKPTTSGGTRYMEPKWHVVKGKNEIFFLPQIDDTAAFKIADKVSTELPVTIVEPDSFNVKMHMDAEITHLTTLKGFPDTLEYLIIDSFNLKAIDKKINAKTIKFYQCYSLTSIENLITENLNFINCPKIESLNGTQDHVSSLRISQCNLLSTLKTETPYKKISTLIVQGRDMNPQLREELNFFYVIEGKEPEDDDYVRFDFDSKNEKQIHIFNWLKSGLSLEDFKEKKRGLVAAKKFGF